MSDTSTQPDTRAEPLAERLRPWIAALTSALLHVLMLAALLWAAKPVLTSPQSAASSGARTRVAFVGEGAPPEQPTPAPPRPKPAKKTPTPPSAAKARERVKPRKPVLEAELIERPSEPKPESRDNPEPPEDSRTQAPAASPPASVQRRSRRWGRPPGLIEEDTAPTDNGRVAGPANRRGNRGSPTATGPSMEVGGYQIIYDLRAETRLRSWMAQGVKELYIPLPGTQYLMACPAEVALRRGSGNCRLLEPDSPELQAIGDARQIITVMYVYHRGDLLWSGPGAYR